MLKIIDSISADFVTPLKISRSISGILFAIFFCNPSLLFAQPITNGGLDNNIYFEEVQIAYRQPVSDPSENFPAAENPGFTNTYEPKQSGNGIFMISGAVFFGFITLLFLKVAPKSKLILLIIGLITLLIMNAQAQPEVNELNNQAYFGEVPGRMGPTNNYSTTSTMSSNPLPPPPPEVPIDGGLAFLAIAGLSVGVYNIYNQSRKKLSGNKSYS